MNPLEWLKAQYAAISKLPARLTLTMERAHAVLSDTTRPMTERQRAGAIWADAMQDRAEVQNILSKHIQVQDYSTESLGIVPVVLLVVGGATALGLFYTLTAIFRRATTYEQELAALQAGALTADQLERIRQGTPTSEGAASTLHELGGLARTAVIAGALWLGFKVFEATRG